MLTGLPNRRGFLALAEKSFARASRKRQSISFIMADIDHFKKVNDRHGHEAGTRCCAWWRSAFWTASGLKIFAAGMAGKSSSSCCTIRM